MIIKAFFIQTVTIVLTLLVIMFAYDVKMDFHEKIFNCLVSEDKIKQAREYRLDTKSYCYHLANSGEL